MSSSQPEMSSPRPERVLKRVPYLRLALNSRNEAQLYVGGRLVSCGPAALPVLEHFARPRPLAAALRELTAGAAPPARAAVIQTIFYLLENGVLRDVTEAAPDAANEAARDPAGGPAADGPARLLVNPGVELSATVSVRGRGGETRSERVDAAERPELLRALVEIASGEWGDERARELPRAILDQLVALEVLTPQDEASDEVYYECFLDESAAELRAGGERGDGTGPGASPSVEGAFESSRRAAAPEDLELGGGLWLQPGAELPAALEGRAPFRDRFREGVPVLWVEDARTGAIWPYWLRDGWPALVADLLSGRASAASLGGRERGALLRAGALVQRGGEGGRVSWGGERARLRAELGGEGYAILRGVVPAPQLAALARYSRALEAKAYLKESSNRHQARNRRTLAGEETARFVQSQLARAVNEIVPESVSPTHATLCVYRPGARLGRHTDIAECRWNISLLVEAEPAAAGLAGAWPLRFESAGRAGEARLAPGDAVLYSGRETPHWRDPLPEGRERETLIFCCFA